MKFRARRSAPEEPAATEEAGPETTSAGVAAPEVTGPAADDPRANGPWDVSEVALDEDASGKVDLGSLIVTPRDGLALQLQVDESTGKVAAVLLAGEKGAVELRVFAAPRNGDIWDDVRQQLAAEVTRRGGTATEAEGPWGPELRVVMGITLPDGKAGQQPSRVFGIRGPRWMLRATMFGQPALEPSPDGIVEQALREVVVRRGPEAHAPGEALPLTVPSDLVPDESTS